MQSLTDLNGYSATEIEVTDDRLAKVLFDRSEPTLQEINITSASVVVPQGFEIEEIINYSTANVRYEIKIQSNDATFITNSTITFPSLPSPVALITPTSSTFEKTFTLRGFTKVSDWDAVKAATWTLWSSYASVDVFNLEVTIIYYDEELGRDINFSYLVYDPDYYYVAELESSSFMTISATGIKPFNITMQSQFDLYDGLRGTLLVLSSLNCSANATKPTVISLSSTASITASLRGLMNNTLELSAFAFLSANPFTNILATSSNTARGFSTDTMYGVNFWRILGNSVVREQRSYSGATILNHKGAFNGSNVLSFETNTSDDTIQYIKTYGYNVGSGASSITIPRTSGINPTKSYVNSDVARALSYNGHYAVLASFDHNSEVFAGPPYDASDVRNHIFLYDSTNTLRQTISVDDATKEFHYASWNSTGVYLVVSYYELEKVSASVVQTARFRVYKRSSNTLTQIHDEGVSNPSGNIRSLHCQTPDGLYVFLGPSGASFERWNRSGDTYSQTGTYIYNNPSNIGTIRYMACTNSHLATFVDRGSSDQIIAIYTIGSGGALTFLTTIAIANPGFESREVVIHWTPDSEYLVYGETVLANALPTANTPLRIWRRFGTTFTELTLDYDGASWPNVDGDVAPREGIVGLDSRST